MTRIFVLAAIIASFAGAALAGPYDIVPEDDQIFRPPTDITIGN